MCSKLCLSLVHAHMHLHMCKHMYTQKHTHTHIRTHNMHTDAYAKFVLVCSCLPIISFNTIFLPCLALELPLLSITSGSSWLYVECPISNFQGSVQREWCTRLSSHCALHITTVSQHLSTAAKYSVQRCSGSHTHCDTGEGQQFC